MPDRKQTPDILGEILGEPVTSEIVVPVKPVRSDRNRQTEAKPQAPRPSAARSLSKGVRWEYMIVSFQNHDGWRPRYVNGQELADWMSGPTMLDLAGQMGDEGWELAAACAGQRMFGAADQYQVFFKRQKALK